MDRQTETALVLPLVVAHEVGVLGDVDGLHGEAAEALAAVDVLFFVFLGLWRWGEVREVS